MSIFTTIKAKAPKRNKFNLSHENKLTCGIGQLIPVLTQEILPGDKMNLNLEHLIKFQPMIHPIMQRVDVFFHAFYVPNRLIWNHWEEFITGGKEGNSFPPKPLITFNNTSNYLLNQQYGVSSLSDYLGFPTHWTGNLMGLKNVQLDAAPFKVYQKIYNDYYRDENLENEVKLLEDETGALMASDSKVMELAKLRNRSYRKDYFTSALPWPQRGPSVPIPIDFQAEIKYNNQGRTKVLNQNGEPVQQEGELQAIGGQTAIQEQFTANIDNSEQLDLDVSKAVGNITDLRRAFKVQEWLEKMARGGARYTEQLWNFFHVKSSDARLQRAEYLGGSHSPVIISEVLQNSSTQETSTPLGDFAGNGTSVSKSGLINRYFEEHGWVMVIMSIMPRASYFQGIPRKYNRVQKEDYYWPQFAHIGEQEILNQELFYNDQTELLNDRAVFGYTPRYAEYRFNPDEVHGEFRDNLEFWHMARKFDAVPPLNANFIHVNNDDVNRVFAVNVDQANPILCQLYFNQHMSRLISRYGTPRL